MPTYEYECTQCGDHVDYFQSMSEPAKTECEKCGGKLTKLLSAGSGLIFKGSGFYITDYKNAGSGAAGSSSSSTEGKSEGGSSEKKSESKPSGESAPKTETSKPAEKKADS